jgi:ABC-type multidrug transport system fused ATPase/permease subunit
VKFRWKWAFAVAGVAFLVVTWFLAMWAFQAKDDARRAAGDRLDRTRDAVARVVFGEIVEANRKLEGASPKAPPPFFKNVDTAEGPAVTSETIPVKDPELWFVFGPANLRVWRRTGPEAYVTGRVPLAELERRMAADPDIGEPGPTKWSRLLLVERDGGVVWPPHDPHLDEKSAKKYERSPGRITRGQQAVQHDAPSERTKTGLPQSYKDADEKLVLSSWAPVEGTGGGLWVLVEVRDAEIVRGTAGIHVEPFGFEVGELMLWHVTLGLSLLMLIASAFFWLPSRGGGAEISVLLRTYQFAKPYKWGIVGAVLVGAIYGASQSFRAFIVKSLIENVFATSDPEAKNAIWGIVWATLVVGAIAAVTNYLKEYLENFYSTSMMADVRVSISRKIVSLPLSFFNKMRYGDLVARIERDIAGMRQVLMQVFDKAFVQPFTLVGGIVAAFMMNWKLALVLFGLPILIVPVFRIAKKIKKRAAKRQNLLADMSHVLLQMLTGIKTVKAFHGEEREAVRLLQANRRFIHEARRIARLAAFSDSLMDFLQMCGGAIVVGVGGFYVLEGEVAVSDLAAFVIVMMTVYAASKDITQVLNKLIEALPSVQRVFEIFDTESDLVDGPKVAPPGPLVHGIELRGVRFKYLETDILKGVDLLVPAGKVVAIVGPTGAGKTTVCDLVARFYDPTEGAVLWDGVDAREYTVKSLAMKLAIVTQDAFLFNAPLDENIRYGREKATDAEVQAAAADANVHDEILSMDGGYSKMAGERGMSLSGGQRQRVTIARALVKDAPVLILDEATSNLDSASEQRVQAALAKLMSGRTVIVVAHRLSTIRNADKVVILQDGRIIEEGAPSDLLARPDSRFRKMWDLQSFGDGGTDDGAAAPSAT